MTFDTRTGDPRQGRLLARPGPVPEAGPTGLIPLNGDGRRDGVLYVPASYRQEQPAPFALMLHGAGGNGRRTLAALQTFADDRGMILLAPDSRDQTWDVIRGGYGADVSFIDAALEHTFTHYAVDEAHLAVEGFSDGASYALSLGLTNGDLFTHVMAFSPGFMVSTTQRGAPRLFISHGNDDRTLPIDVCSHRLTPRLEAAGYDLTFVEFSGGHTVPPDIVERAVIWFLS